MSTAEDNGILLYNGDNDHIAVELFEGHVKVSYDPGSQPSHAIYRYARRYTYRAQGYDMQYLILPFLLSL